MLAVFRKEIVHYFGSQIGVITIAFFLTVFGLFMWVLPEYSILSYPYATMDQLFIIAPFVLTFLVPAICMRSFSVEFESGTFELLSTRPLSTRSVVGGKFLACVTLTCLAILPTVIYYFSLVRLGSPPGNIDGGQVAGSYLGLIMLAAAFCAIGVFASAVTRNQIVAFLVGVFLCFFFYLVIDLIADASIFYGNLDTLISSLGLESHYESASRGLIDTRDIVFFGAFMGLFLLAANFAIELKK